MAHEKVDSIVASARTNFPAFQWLYSTAIYILCLLQRLNSTVQKHNMSHNWFVKIPAGAP